MVIDAINIELKRTGETAVLTCQGRPYGVKVTLTLTELEAFIHELSDAATAWRHERHTVDYYAALGVPRDATGREITNAYRRLARQFHPDTSQGETGDTMSRINEAYAVLGDPLRRQEYDRTL